MGINSPNESKKHSCALKKKFPIKLPLNSKKNKLPSRRTIVCCNKCFKMSTHVLLKVRKCFQRKGADQKYLSKVFTLFSTIINFLFPIYFLEHTNNGVAGFYCFL